MLASRASWAAGSGRRTAIVRVNLNLDRAAPAQDGPSATTNGFGLTARLLCALVVALANRIPKWACEHRGPVGCVLRNMRRDVEVAQIVHELAHIVTFRRRA